MKAATLTKPQAAMLYAAAATEDGTVLGHGFSHGRHAIATGKALIARGLLVEVKGKASYTIYRITEAGRSEARR